MSIAIYFRCSTDKQNLDHQRASVRKWIEEKGYDLSTIVEYSDEGISGIKGSDIRLGFGELVNEIKKHKIKRVILFEHSRASRDFMQFLQFLDLCSKNKCQIEVVGEGDLNFNSSTDKLMASIQAFLNEAEREKISSRTKSGLAKAKENGVKLGAPKGSKGPLGRRKKHDPKMLDEIRKHTAKGLSLKEIADILKDRFTPQPITFVTIANLRRRYGIIKPRKQVKQ